ncbi:hypothetical protein CYMTET_15319, partial [Cymbomonas tetramitiformis]
ARCTPSQDMGDASATIAPQTSPSMPPGRGAVPAEATTKVDTMAVTARLTGAPAPLSFREVKERKASARQQKACLPGGALSPGMGVMHLPRCVHLLQVRALARAQ